MYTIKKIILFLFIGSAPLSVVHTSCAVNETSSVQSTESNSTDYDAFDAMADEMVDRGITQDEPKPLSTIDRWVQSICSPIIMKYVLLKGYMRDWGYWMIGVKKN